MHTNTPRRRAGSRAWFGGVLRRRVVDRNASHVPADRALIGLSTRLRVHDIRSLWRVEDELRRGNGHIYRGAFEGKHIAIALRVEDEHAPHLRGGGIDIEQYLLKGGGGSSGGAFEHVTVFESQAFRVEQP